MKSVIRQPSMSTAAIASEVPATGRLPNMAVNLQLQSTAKQLTIAIQQDNAIKLSSLLGLTLREKTDTQIPLDGWEINKMDAQGRTLLHETIIADAVECAQLLLSHDKVNTNIPDNQGWTPLFWAVNRGQTETVKKLVELGCDIKARDLSGNTLLHEAAECGHADLCQILLDFGCDVNIVNLNGECPLVLAATPGHDNVLTRLVKAGADVNLQTATGATALLFSAICGNIATTKLLLAAGADTTLADSEGNTPLILSSKYGHQGAVKLLLESTDTVIDHQNISGRTALHTAAESNNAEIVKLLLDAGISPTATDKMGKTALSVAAQQGNFSVLQLLAGLETWLNVADFISMTPLHWVVVGGHRSCVRELLAHGADLNIGNAGTGNTALMLAVDCGYKDIATQLIQAGCNVNAVNSVERSALHEAAERGYVCIIKLLVAAGAHVNTQTSKGDTPLIIATRRGHLQAVEVLLEVGSDVNLSNSQGTAALHEACLWGHVDIAGILLAGGADIDLPEADGDTPLLLAATKDHVEVVRLLLEHGCDPNHVNYVQRSALLEAAEFGYADIAKALIGHGADLNAQDSEGDSALILAASKANHLIVEVLLETNCDRYHVNKWGRNALHEACCAWTGRSQSVDYLLRDGMDPDGLDHLKDTPLTLSILSGRNEAVWYLIRANCDVNKPGTVVGDKLVRPIQVAVTKEAMNIAQMLYMAGCDINPVNIWMKEEGGPVYVLPVRSIELKEWLEAVTSTPTSLKLLCRAAIRKLLGINRKLKMSEGACGVKHNTTGRPVCECTKLLGPAGLGGSMFENMAATDKGITRTSSVGESSNPSALSGIDELPLPGEIKRFLHLEDLAGLVYPPQLNPADLFDDDDNVASDDTASIG